jgi:hypothetical protein
MGVLDDAIKEHLELKRRHGAPEDELRRQEEEALGPVRREVVPEGDEAAGDGGEQPVEASERAAEESAEAGPEAPQAPFDGDAPPPEPGADADAPEPFPEEAAPTVRRASEHDEPLPDAEELEASDYPPAPEDHMLEPDQTEDSAPHAAPADELDDFDDVDEADDDEAAESETPGDVLEDTPDFLEETPEHDRLWFEQKPPRDFDFD